MRLTLAALMITACAKPPTSEPPAPERPSIPSRTADQPEGPQADIVTAQTALVTVLLHPDGRLEFTGLAVKPIAFRRRNLVPFEPAAHQVSPSPATAPVSSGTAIRSRAAASRGPTALVVRARHTEQPWVVSAELGGPGEGGGDVADRWANGTVILRAPYFGEGTQFSLVRETAEGPVELETWSPN